MVYLEAVVAAVSLSNFVLVYFEPVQSVADP